MFSRKLLAFKKVLKVCVGIKESNILLDKLKVLFLVYLTRILDDEILSRCLEDLEDS